MTSFFVWFEHDADKGKGWGNLKSLHSQSSLPLSCTDVILDDKVCCCADKKCKTVAVQQSKSTVPVGSQAGNLSDSDVVQNTLLMKWIHWSLHQGKFTVKLSDILQYVTQNLPWSCWVKGTYRLKRLSITSLTVTLRSSADCDHSRWAVWRHLTFYIKSPAASVV